MCVSFSALSSQKGVAACMIYKKWKLKPVSKHFPVHSWARCPSEHTLAGGRCGSYTSTFNTGFKINSSK